MQAVASTIFQIVQFPFQGMIITINQLDFIKANGIMNDANKVLLMNTPQYQNIGVVLPKESSLMGVFPLSNPPLASHTTSINMISTSIIDKGKSIVESTSLSPFEELYNAIQTTSDPTINDHLLVASNPYHLPYWLDNPTHL